ncbi:MULTISPECIES: ATP-binding protein [Streptomycetaceae]|uniref:Histidine kinase/HSP90-like ATPase domain-containing protein n=1 Tax=Streptantibioticus cattleyicolor (strain ATCC 35852 / DSM 46488 / JCM 4925 / NBRC 14057 / NRRL 8057) TaxID=1003195 RepID=F8JPF1_STREN|nr:MULTISPECIES: ATP-binding protein [Streptomycetaceae]AEW96507.1 hypothetical protein SCATT_41360 [Streptantibioticus cattleyicolor NRRL 8057 = DSM 46488]MYS61009.1 ATP-binding protein [Streptomyces sp. SID5468]CCB76843.1 putative regulatory protein containing a conserved C-terminal domain [Streptantibioticus cattleyicolor NRRL 8057 = DSM 46488]
MGTECSLVFPPDPMWVRSAREAVRTLLTLARRGAHVDVAVLLTSEAVTNAVDACARARCSAPVTVYAEHGARCGEVLRVLVHDEAPGEPVVRAVGADDEHGRGMPLISAWAAEWGVCRYGPARGKTVWFELATPVPGR